MTESDLDAAYSQLCRTMTGLGERQTELYLARFALLAMLEIDDAGAIARITAAAAEGLAEPEAAAVPPPDPTPD